MTNKRKVFESLNLQINLSAWENKCLDNNQFKICISGGVGKCLHLDNDGNYYFEDIPGFITLNLPQTKQAAKD
jgi:hypothetical protein